MLIAQISDFHVTEPPALAYGRVDTGAALSRAVDALNRLDPQPDLVIGSGDLVQSGTEGEYRSLSRILEPLRAPFVPALGNHDARVAFCRAFDGRPGVAFADDYAQYVVELETLAVVIADTVREGHEEGEYCETRARWLRSTLAAQRKPVLLVLHHPPFAASPPWLDPPDPEWAKPIGDAIERSRARVVRILSGHVHRAVFGSWRGIPCSTCASTAHQVALKLNSTTPLLSREAPSFQLHRWSGDAIVSYVGAFAGLFDTFVPEDQT